MYLEKKTGKKENNRLVVPQPEVPQATAAASRQ
jgi:hypothetical protein